MALIRNIDDFKKVVAVGKNLDFTEVSPFNSDAELKYIVPALGQTLYDSLNTKVTNNTALSADEAVALDYARKCIASFAVMNWFPLGQVQISSAGVQIVSNENAKTAFKWQIDQLQQQCFSLGYTALDALLLFLESKRATFTDWAASSSRTFFHENYITNASELTLIAPIVNESRSIFLKLKNIFAEYEENLLTDIISAAEDTVLRTAKKAGTLTTLQKKAVIMIQRLIAYNGLKEGLPVLSLKLDTDGLLAFDSTGRVDSAKYNKTAPVDAIDNLVKHYTMKATDTEAMLRKLLAANLDVFTAYAASTSVPEPRVEISGDDKIINFL
jgi:hypothetical protein